MLLDYEKLKEVMRKAGADVIKLDHEQFDKMSPEDRMLLFGTYLYGGQVLKWSIHVLGFLYSNK